ncbi:MAG TPA: hypothetical protein PKE47_06725, partial [Verrucomicrobiota bacterium]|nr:hypothetical protein [Verrucomicrobiota bacterium]
MPGAIVEEQPAAAGADARDEVEVAVAIQVGEHGPGAVGGAEGLSSVGEDAAARVAPDARAEGHDTGPKLRGAVRNGGVEPPVAVQVAERDAAGVVVRVAPPREAVREA